MLELRDERMSEQNSHGVKGAGGDRRIMVSFHLSGVRSIKNS